MRLNFLSPLLFVFGLVLVILSVVRGEADFALFLVFPVIYGGGVLLFGGILLIFLSFIVLPITWMQNVEKPKEHHIRKTKGSFGGVVFIGPIPIVFGSERRVTRLMLYVALALAALMFVLYLYLIYSG